MCGRVALANANSCSHSLCAIARPSVVCLSSVTLVRPTQAVEIFGNFSRAFDTLPLPPVDIHGKFYGDRPRGTPPSGELNIREVAKYSAFV